MEQNKFSIIINKVLNFICDSSDDLVSIIDKNFIIHWLSEDSFHTILGYVKSDILKSSILDLFHQDDKNYIIKNLMIEEKIEDQEKLFSMRIRQKDGNFKWFELKYLHFLLQNKELMTVLLFRKKTQRNEKEENIKLSQELSEYLVKNTSEILIVLDEHGVIESINKGTLTNSMGFTKKDLIGKNWRELIHPNYKIDISQMFRNGFEHEIHEVPVINQKGDLIHLEVRGTTYTDGEDNLKTLLMARDISNRKQIEKLLKQLETNAQIRIEKLDFYNAVISNDFNNVLQKILKATNIISSLSDNVYNKEEIEPHLEKIKIQSKNGINLVSIINTLSEIDNTVPLLKKIDVIQSLADTIKTNQNKYGKNVSFHIETESVIYHIYANELIQVMFDNIIKECIVHEKNINIEIVIKASIEEIHDRKYLMMEFSHNGKYNDKSLLKKNHQRDIQNKTPEDISLGMVLVKKIVEMFKGELKLADIEDKLLKSKSLILKLPLI